MLDAGYLMLDKKENWLSYPASSIYSFRAPKSGTRTCHKRGGDLHFGDNEEMCNKILLGSVHIELEKLA